MVIGFILGLSSGGICLLYCMPVLLPFLMGEGQTMKKNYMYLARFMAGRLAGYIAFALLAWLTGKVIITHTAYREMIFASAYVLLSIWMMVYLFSKTKGSCSVRFFAKFFARVRSSQSWWGLMTAGFLTGINLCPPFLLAFSDAAFSSGIVESIVYFVFFFAGTSFYFLPVPLIGAVRNEKLKIIGRMSAAMIALFYLYTGIIMFAGSVYLL